jgi:hypothetical protein
MPPDQQLFTGGAAETPFAIAQPIQQIRDGTMEQESKSPVKREMLGFPGSQ